MERNYKRKISEAEQNYALQTKKRFGDIPIDDKLKLSEPFRMFLCSSVCQTETHKEVLTISFPELFDKRLGELESSMQINFMVEIDWLIAQYALSDTANVRKPMTLVYGMQSERLETLLRNNKLPHITAALIPTPPFGTHHTKMMVCGYTDKSIRVIVSTANLIEHDWDYRTQGLWISPKLPYVESSTCDENDSETGFKRDFLRYLKAYNQVCLDPWISRIEKCDFSSINVIFVASVPGSRTNGQLWGLEYLETALRSHVTADVEPTGNSWPIIMQFSSIGSLGPTPASWLLDEVGHAMSATFKGYSKAPVNLIYPSFRNVEEGDGGILIAGGGLPYRSAQHVKQEWVVQFMNQWRSEERHRTKSIPHIKSYCRISGCTRYLAWFCLTSANLSKAAWGKKTAKSGSRINNYEAGVLFLPRFVTGKTTFSTINSDDDECKFPLPYDVPLTGYENNDIPFVMDVLLA